MNAKKVRLLLLVLLIAETCEAHGWGTRSTHERYLFRKATPCPVNASMKGACRGFVIDHRVPLCAGGPDRASNMQWQSIKKAAAKDVEERRLCRMTKAGTIPAGLDAAGLCAVLKPAQWPLMTKAVCS